jgi:predicted helicase
VSTNRDEWVFDADPVPLSEKIKFFIEIFNHQIETLDQKGEAAVDDWIDYSIKWSDVLKKNLIQKEKIIFDDDLISQLAYRPFVKRFYYAEKRLSDRLTSNHYELFGNDLLKENFLIAFSGTGSSKPFSVLSSNAVFSLDFLEKTQCLPLYRYDRDGQRGDNITDWALKQFQSHYRDKAITRPDIFHYVYAVLHDPAYREKYRLNLKRKFPRIPLYDDFRKWAAWGRKLMELHLGYEQADPFPLKRMDKTPESGKPSLTIKTILKADKANRTIQLDSTTTLKGVPLSAWEYRLGNRSAIEWVLEYHKERKPKDSTIREKFDTYRFADHKEKVIDLLQRVCTVSMETMKIINTIEKSNLSISMDSSGPMPSR